MVAVMDPQRGDVIDLCHGWVYHVMEDRARRRGQSRTAVAGEGLDLEKGFRSVLGPLVDKGVAVVLLRVGQTSREKVKSGLEYLR